eukprot:CAMPEP_0117075612 /NCGR_PEP_ID=MMETSP0472-20121206/53308_1 /TAXON_ID=693140 ORGANISM="Tiarina fusus, Strain LIS" /NCGR_SAMPLE_ID=MMETSP0472 /ASSEMBLY_ACC=CAM_ASM_000603 /LENGTH=89 /DNA_ID=CAMNT_0004801187 /DNA_START=13 /DNA_END=283 /DNA_ORIENTATION=+
MKPSKGLDADLVWPNKFVTASTTSAESLDKFFSLMLKSNMVPSKTLANSFDLDTRARASKRATYPEAHLVRANESLTGNGETRKHAYIV